MNAENGERNQKRTPNPRISLDRRQGMVPQLEGTATATAKYSQLFSVNSARFRLVHPFISLTAAYLKSPTFITLDHLL